MIQREHNSYYIYVCHHMLYMFFFFNDTATTEIYTLSLHDALPICLSDPVVYRGAYEFSVLDVAEDFLPQHLAPEQRDRKSTRLNSSHGYISYAVFCLKKKKKKHQEHYKQQHNNPK